jgi:hypothetical protein
LEVDEEEEEEVGGSGCGSLEFMAGRPFERKKEWERIGAFFQLFQVEGEEDKCGR